MSESQGMERLGLDGLEVWGQSKSSDMERDVQKEQEYDNEDWVKVCSECNSRSWKWNFEEEKMTQINVLIHEEELQWGFML